MLTGNVIGTDEGFASLQGGTCSVGAAMSGLRFLGLHVGQPVRRDEVDRVSGYRTLRRFGADFRAIRVEPEPRLIPRLPEDLKTLAPSGRLMDTSPGRTSERATAQSSELGRGHLCRLPTLGRHSTVHPEV